VRRAKILHLTTVHGPFDNRIFGMQAKSLAAAGYDVTLATTVDAAGSRDGVRLLPLGSIARASRRMDRIGRNVRALRVAARAYDIVHVHDPELLIVAGICAAFLGRHVVYDVHEYYDEKFSGDDVTAAWIPGFLLSAVRTAYGFAERTVLPRAAGVVVVSERMLPRYQRLLPPERVAVVQNFPSLTREEVAAARATSRPLDVPYFVHTGGASKDRSFDVLVATAEKLRTPIVNLGAIELEEYPTAQRRALLERAQAAGVIMPGSVPHAEAVRWIAHADAGYLPLANSENNRRGQPRKLFEYMLFGLPVVASDVGNIGNIVREHGVGVTVPPHDPLEHARALEALTADAGLRMHYARKARAAAPSFSFATQLPNLIDLYERILAREDERGERRHRRRHLRAVS